MPIEQLSYEQIRQRLNASPHAARALLRRLRLLRALDNRGGALISIDFAEIDRHKRAAKAGPSDDQPVIARLRERIAVLESELAAARQRSEDDHAAFVAERARCDSLILSLIELKLEGRPQPWWRRWLKAA